MMIVAIQNLRKLLKGLDTGKPFAAALAGFFMRQIPAKTDPPILQLTTEHLWQKFNAIKQFLLVKGQYHIAYDNLRN